jgi:hypothetical protein
MNGEWPIVLQAQEMSRDEELHQEYQADRASDKDLPGGKRNHERRTKHALAALERSQDEGSEA